MALAASACVHLHVLVEFSAKSVTAHDPDRYSLPEALLLFFNWKRNSEEVHRAVINGNCNSC